VEDRVGLASIGGAAMEVGDLHKVWEVRALKTKPDAAAAQATLDRVARQVQPIMCAKSGALRSSLSSRKRPPMNPNPNLSSPDRSIDGPRACRGVWCD